MKRYLEEFDWVTLKSLAPFMAVSVLVSAVLVLGVLQASGAMRTGGGTLTVAVFDVVKFANAQRAVASAFIGKKDDASEAGILLLSLSKKTTAVIQKVAGTGTLVLVKQGVVSGSQLDITDAVLKELGLPTDVPTVGPMSYLQDIAPTMLMLAPSKADSVKAPPTTSASSQVLP